MEMESSLSFMTFKGSVAEAIAEAKNQRKLLVVYISGDDADTSSLERCSWRSLNVVESVSKYCILLHLSAESGDGTQFSATYAEKSTPCITAVGYNGVKFWQHEGFVDAEVLASSLKKAWLNLRTKETTATVVKAATASKKSEVITNSTPEGTSSAEDHLQIPEDKPKVASTKAARNNSRDDHRVSFIDDNNARDNKSKKGVKSNDVYLNIRLVNGVSLQEKFSFTNTLQMVKEYVDNNQASEFSSYDLAIPYPRKLFNDQELSKSLSELGLFNRQALIVVPRQRPTSDAKEAALSSSTQATPTNSHGYFGFLKPILSFLNPFTYLGTTASSSNSEQESHPSIGEYGPNTISDDSSHSSQNQSSSKSRGNDGRPATSRPGSNIHMLKHDEDDEQFSDRNTFWNGNSTQYGGDGEAK